MFTKVRISKCCLIVLVKCPKMKEKLRKRKKPRAKNTHPPPMGITEILCLTPSPCSGEFCVTLSYIESNSVFQMCKCLFLYCLITPRKDVCKVCQWRKEAKCSSHTSIYLQGFPAGFFFTGALLDGTHLENDVSNINMCTYSIISGLLLLLFRPPDPKIYTRLSCK